MIRCPNCQMDNIEGAAFCDNCGKPLPAAPPPMPPTMAASPIPASPVQPTMPASSGGVVCPTCGTPALPGELYCSNCGTALAAPAPNVPPMPITPPPPVAPPPPPVMSQPPVVAPVMPTAPIAPPGAGPTMSVAPPVPLAQPYLMVVADGTRINLARSEVLVGRVDPVSGVFPEVDLTPHGGEEGGVSRRHLKITQGGDQYFVEDLNSTNGTWIGQSRVQPGARVPLNNGDQLRLGKVLLNFFTG